MLSFRRLSHLRRGLHTSMSRRSQPPSPDSSPRVAKRPRLEYAPLTSEDYKNGLMLAPMVRSGALPTRLYALKHGAKLVWGPETIDKAILHTTREVDPVTGVVSYHGKSKAIFTTHPIEKPFLIYQIGSADPELAVQAAKMVQQDVSGFDLNCGCPKPFSTHAGMGAALLTNPDLLCSILTALREAMPPEITVSAKIRLLPSQEDTLKLVERIVNTGISALTVHCRTRNMRMKEKAVIERLREIVEFVEKMGKGIAVIENGDCLGYEDSKRVREVTGAHSVMIATAAEANPTCFSPTPLKDLELTFVPSYIRLGKYLGNHWSSTKFCATQFQGRHENTSRNELKALRETIVRAKGYEDMETLVAPWTGEQEFAEIVKAIESRGGQRAPPIPLQPVAATSASRVAAAPKDVVIQETSDSTPAAQSIPAAVLGLDIPPPASAEAIAV
ncbi:FMN-linked oxidoreductase [Cerioporus squamosus]|nr:FMN-linked oxidoreductase [Cerioporus squamosus]